MALEHTFIQEKIAAKFGDKVGGFHEPFGLLSFETEADTIVELVGFLKNDETLNFFFLTDLCGAHFPDNDEDTRFAVIYHLHNLIENTRLRIKVYLPESSPAIPSISSVFSAANWQERETFDFYGIIFTGHPDLKRILNMDEMEVFPLRKEYPLEDAGRNDKDDRFFGRTIHNL